jgi:hypothetical protein
MVRLLSGKMVEAHEKKGEERTMSYSKACQGAVSSGIVAAMLAAVLWLPATGAFAQGVEIVSNLTPATYEVTTLSPGDEYYVDRDYTIISMPSDLQGAVGIKTANDDKSVSTETHIEFDLSQKADVYIAYDNRAISLPDWMGGFSAIGESIAVGDEDASPLQLYKKAFPSGHVALGGNMATGAVGAGSSYIVLLTVAELRVSGRTWLEVGETLNLTAIVTGPVIGTLSYQWSKDGGDLTGETGSSLTVVGVAGADEGVYRVTVQDESGDDPMVSTGADVRIFGAGVLPLAGYVGLGILASACALTGAAVIRRKKR